MATFRDLKTHAEKIIKFKQGKVADNDLAFWENMNVSLQGGKFQFGQGVCAALTIRFLFELLSNNNLIDFDSDSTKFSFKRDQGVSSKNETNMGLYNEAIKHQSNYSIKFDVSGNAQAVRAMASDFGLAPAEAQVVSGDSNLINFGFASFISTECQRAVAGKAAYVAFSFKKKNGDVGSHAVGIGTRLGMIYFFDSNIGGYKIAPDKLMPFFEAYVRCYSVGWDIQDQGLEAHWFKKA